MNPRPSINLHIEELVLHGFAPGDRHGIGEAVQVELARLLSEQPLPTSLGKKNSLEHVNAGTIQLRKDARPGVVGGQIASAIHGGLKQ